MKNYVLIFFMILSFQGIYANDNQSVYNVEVDKNIHYEFPELGDSITLSEFYDEDELDKLANADRNYEEHHHRTVHSYFPSWMKRFGILLLLHYASLRTFVAKKVERIKKSYYGSEDSCKQCQA